MLNLQDLLREIKSVHEKHPSKSADRTTIVRVLKSRLKTRFKKKICKTDFSWRQGDKHFQESKTIKSFIKFTPAFDKRGDSFLNQLSP